MLAGIRHFLTCKLRAPIVGSVAAVLCFASTSLASAVDAGPLTFDPKGKSVDRFTPLGWLDYEPVSLRAHDGIQLYARVYRPNRPIGDPRRPASEAAHDPDWKTPVILVDTPYNDELGFSTYSFTPTSAIPLGGFIPYFTAKGFTVVLADSRGTANSEGCTEHFGPNEARDLETLVEHFASQPWSNGKVGGWGISYDGSVLNAGAVLAPDGLVTMITTAATSGLYERYSFDGVPYIYDAEGSWSQYFVNGYEPGEDPSLKGLTDRSACDPHQLEEHLSAQQTGTMTGYFRDREFRRRVKRVEASVLYVQGFLDHDVTPVNIVGWYDELPVFKRAIFGQWGHVFPDQAGSFGRDDFVEMMHAWYDQWLLGLDTGVASWPPLQVQDEGAPGADGVVWRAEDSFASLGEEHHYPLGSDRTLGGPTEAAASADGSELEQSIWRRMVDEPLHLSGQAFLDVDITLDRDDAHFAVELWEQRPNGLRRLLTEGYLSAQHRKSLTDPSPVVPGRRYSYSIRTLPFDKWVAPRSTLELVLSGVNVDTPPPSSPVKWKTLPAGNQFRMRIATDGSSILRLPVVERVCGLDVIGARGQASRDTIPPCPPRDRPHK